MNYKILLIIAFVLGLTSCNKFLDITPDGQVKREEMLKTQSGIEDALYGVYAQLRQGGLYGQALTIGDMEVLAQNMDCYGNTRLTSLGQYDYENTSVEETFTSVWQNMYKNISNVNSVLACDLVKDATAFPYNIYKGEGLALRAFMHFDLVRIFLPPYSKCDLAADGIPYQMEFSLNTPNFESISKNYEHIIADLKEAETLLANETQQTENHQKEYGTELSFMADRQIHLSIYAVKALLARVYMTMGNKTEALRYAQDVIEHGPCTLKEKIEVIDDVAGVLSQKECLFGVYYADFFTVVKNLLHQTTSYTSLDPRPDFEALYNTDMDGQDYRLTAYFTGIEYGGAVKYRLSKFTDIYELNDMAGSRPAELILGINLIRLPEMYYICAECLLDTDKTKAMEYLEAVRAHRGLEPLAKAEPSRTITIDDINLDRKKEYYGEGYMFFEYKRQYMPILSCDGTMTFEPQNIYVIPIPDEEYSNRY